MARFELEQDGMVVAAVDGPREDALRDIAHYGLMYGQDGPVTTYEVIGRRRIKLAELTRTTDRGGGE